MFSKLDEFAELLRWNYNEWLQDYPDNNELQRRIAQLVADEFRGIDVVRPVWEIGYGTGVTTVEVLKAHPGITIRGIDLSPVARVMACEYVATHCPGRSFFAEIGDASESLFGQRKAWVIYSAHTLHNLEPEHRADVLRLVSNSLFPGGLFVNGDKVVPPDDSEYYRLFVEQGRSFYAALGKGVSYKTVMRWIDHAYIDDSRRLTEAEHIQGLVNAGLVDVKVNWRHGMYAIITGRKPK